MDEKQLAQLKEEAAKVEKKRAEDAEAMMVYNKKNEEYKEIIKQREAEMRIANQSLIVVKRSLAEAETRIASIDETIKARVEEALKKLDATTQAITTRDMLSAKREEESLQAFRAAQDRKAEIEKMAIAVSVDQARINKARGILSDLEKKEAKLNEKETATIKANENLESRETRLNALASDVELKRLQIQKTLDILDGKQRGLDSLIASADATREKYVLECNLLNKREEGISKKENELALQAAKNREQQAINEVTAKSLEDTRFELTVMEARLNKEIKRRKMEEELAAAKG